MATKQPFKILLACAVFAATMSPATQAQTTCPSDAICRDDLAPGKYSERGPYGYDSYSMPLFSTPGGATVYYPEDAKPPYSVMVFCPPYLTQQIGFREWGPFFASHGIVTVLMDTTTIYDQVDSRSDQQAEVLDAMKLEHTRRDSPLLGNLDLNRFGVIGWSMGGGASWINSVEYPELRSAVTLAGHNQTSLDPDSRGRNTRIPTMIFNGALDTTILGGLGQSDGVYDSIPAGTPKAFYEVASSGHFDWGYPTQANDYVAELALAFQKAYLDGDLRWAPFIERPRFDVSEYEEEDIPN
ncbi:dienelactone hydrolase family protein [Halioxenophilus aromaticivorans]|uniref:PET hydrolase/cutinase-like domain-containing protein n=1 Tax=Halioxenophilus aromaticivorans TaxID=1306992 RepID=A0AAV3U1W9_9ALTE